MKANPLVYALLVLLTVTVQLPAQQPVPLSTTNAKPWERFVSKSDAQLTNAVEIEVFGEYKAKAEKGDADAEYQLGLMYWGGIGVATNYPTAVKWCRKAADQGVSDSQEMLGHAYEIGLGVPKDYVEAAK